MKELLEGWEKAVAAFNKLPWPSISVTAIGFAAWGWLSYKDEVADRKKADGMTIEANRETIETQRKYINLQEKTLTKSYLDTTKH